jgi:MFS family permease
VAAGLRLWHLGTTPTPLHVDEASAGVAAWNLPTLLFHVRLGRLAALAPVHAMNLSLVLEMVILRVFGAGAFQLRLGSVIYGVAAVVGMFLLARALFDEGAGLVAATLMAVLHLPIAYARLGIPNTQAMCMLIFASWLLVEAINRNRWRWYAAAAVVGALGTYSYFGFRAFLVIAPAVVAFQLIGDLVARRDVAHWRQRALGLSVAAGLAIVLAAPLEWKALHGDEGGLNETRRLSLVTNMSQFEAFYHTQDDGSIVRRQLRADWNYYEFGRDGSTHFRYAGPALDPLTRILFVAGMAVALLTFWRLRSQVALLLFWIPFIVASLVDSPPLGPRLLLTFPGVILLVTTSISGLAEAFTWIVQRKAVAYGAVGLLLLVPAINGPYTYFVRYHSELDYFPWISPHSEVGEFARTFDGDVLTLDTLNRGLYPAETHLRFYNKGRDNIIFYKPGDDVQPGHTAFAVVADDTLGLQAVEQRFPGGETREIIGHVKPEEKTTTVIARIYVVDVP